MIPLALQSKLAHADERLHPVFVVEASSVVLDPLQIFSIATDRLGERVGSLSNEGDRIIAATDLVITRAFG